MDSGSAANPDGDADVADTAPALPQAVTVNVVRSMKPAAGVTVVFHDASGAVLGSTKTDAAGKAVSTGAIPAQVSVLLGAASWLRSVHTWTSVEAGDELFVTDFSPMGGEELGHITVTLPGEVMGSSWYYANVGSCGVARQGKNVGTPASITMRAECVRPQNAILGRSAGDRTNGFAFLKGVPAPAPAAGVDVTLGSWWFTAAMASVNILNPPSSLTNTKLDLDDILGDVAYPSDSMYLKTATASLAFAAGFADAHQFTALDGAYPTPRSLVTRIPSTKSSVTLDFGTAPPAIKDMTLAATNRERPELSWTLPAGMSTVDGALGAVDYQADNQTKYRWSFVLPPNATSARFPELPAEVADWVAFTPKPAEIGFSGFTSLNLTLVSSDLLDGYGAFRTEVGRLVPLEFDEQYRVSHIMLPKDGALATTISYAPLR
ncbi:hypothetical protein AKJ09_02967 [Labilithrix luteola]|uniref:Uncharacterized protein n=1 Tax=Labilithrix luteola TaxID=1391654 RepID=A0A0K1PRZ9_9BACT|nr:hypothetical protein [Labilithrix luteola]AKU96303.1 hypothetical protein AKJ09_02967 [Labilithrix luteola]